MRLVCQRKQTHAADRRLVFLGNPAGVSQEHPNLLSAKQAAKRLVVAATVILLGYVIPCLQTVDRFNQELQNVGGVNLNVAEWIREHLLKILEDEELERVVAPLPQGYPRYSRSGRMTLDLPSPRGFNLNVPSH